MKTIAGPEIERLMVVVDVRTWLLHPNSRRLASMLQLCVSKFLSSSSPSSRWAFKLFDSSMAPFPSRCRIGKLLGNWACSSRFDSVQPGGDSPAIPEVFSQFRSALNCLYSELVNDLGSVSRPSDGNAKFVALNLLELLCDYVWDPLLATEEHRASSLREGPHKVPLHFNSNLVLLFSSFPSTGQDLSSFLNVKKILSQQDLFTGISSSFRKLQESLQAKNIKLCWIDVPQNITSADYFTNFGFNKDMIYRSALSWSINQLGWSSVSLETLLICGESIPVSLLWQGLVYSSSQMFQAPQPCFHKVYIQVKDVCNKPITTLLCKVRAASSCKILEMPMRGNVFKIYSVVPNKKLSLSNVSLIGQTILFQDYQDPKAPASKVRLAKLGSMLKKAYKDGTDRNVICDHILRQLQQEDGTFESGKPAWQLLLLYLARVESLAIVEICEKGSGVFGLLEPLTAHFAVLTIFDRSALLDIISGCLDDNLTENVSQEGSDQQNTNISVNTPSNFRKRKAFDSIGLAHYSELVSWLPADNGSKRAKPTSPDGIIHVTGYMSSLEDLYLKGDKRSKILRALSCWIKQPKDCMDLMFLKKVQCPSLSSSKVPSISTIACVNPQHVGTIENAQGASMSSNTCSSNSPITAMDSCCNLSSDFAAQNLIEAGRSILTSSCFSESCSLSDGEAGVKEIGVEDAKQCIANVEQRIADCLTSHEIDIYHFAVRVVADVWSAFSALHQNEIASSEGLCQKSDNGSCFHIIEKLMEVLLQNPKRLSAKYKSCQPPIPASQTQVVMAASNSYFSSAEDKLREYELQILFRMEILSFSPEVSGQKYMIEELTNEICTLLESIQFNLPGGVLEGESLFDFSNKVIKERYAERLGGVVERIYMAMEFNGHDDTSEVDEDSVVLKASMDLATAAGNGHTQKSQCTEAEDMANESDILHVLSHYTKAREKTNLQRALFERVDAGPSNKQQLKALEERRQAQLRKAAERRERAKRFSHFASFARDALKVTVVPKVGVSIKAQQQPRIKPYSNGSKQQATGSKHRAKVCDKEVIVQTPLLPKSHTAKCLLP